jgi:ADP-ribose diphosphatase
VVTTKPRTLSRRAIARSRLFGIEAVELEFANGSRRVFERILGNVTDSVLVVPLTAEGSVLLVREYAAGFDRYELGLPKGILEPGEAVLDAANREIQEEVGQAARDLRLLATVTLAPAYIRHRTHLVLARGLYARALPGDEPESLEVVAWSLGELEGLFAREDFSEARSIAALCLTRRFLAREAAGESPAPPEADRSIPRPA